MGGIIDQTTYENLKKKLEKFSVAESDLLGSTVAAAVMVTQRPQVTQSIIDQMESNLILDKLKEELGEENYNDMKEDLESLVLLASSLKKASTEEKTEILKKITQKRQKVDSKIEQLKEMGKLTSESATKVKLTLNDMVTSGTSSTESEESRQVIDEVKSSLGLALQNLKDDFSSNLNLNKLENLVAQLNSVDHDDEDPKEQVVLISVQIGEEKQKLLDKLEDDHMKGIIDQTTYESLKKKLEKFSVAESDLHRFTVAAAVVVTQRPQVTQSI